MGGALYCASFGGAISKISTMLLHCHGSVAAFQGGSHAALSSRPGANVLGCSGNDPLKSLDFSLSLHRIVLTRHLLLTKAAVVDTVRVVEEETRFLVLATDNPRHVSRAEHWASARQTTEGPFSPPPPSPDGAGPGTMHSYP